MTALLSAVALVGLGHVVARYTGPRWAASVAKPVPIALLAFALAAAPAPADERYRWLVVGGLLCSMAGDVWLLFPRHFRRGLACFLVAHLFYIAAFSRAGSAGAGSWIVLLPFALAGAAMLAYLWPHLARERAAVALYIAVLVVMGWRAALLVATAGAAPGSLALAGALCFLVSDGTLATDRFVRPFRTGDAVVMTTYYAAQVLIATSALV